LPLVTELEMRVVMSPFNLVAVFNLVETFALKAVEQMSGVPSTSASVTQ
jgi:hypothetical protein